MGLRVVLDPGSPASAPSSSAASSRASRFSSTPPSDGTTARVTKLYQKGPPSYPVTKPSLAERSIYVIAGIGFVLGSVALSVLLPAIPLVLLVAAVMAVGGGLLIGSGVMGQGTYIWTNRYNTDQATEAKLSS